MGVAVGFLLPPQVVPNSESLEDVGKDLGVMFFAGAAVCTLVLGLMLFGEEFPLGQHTRHAIHCLCKIIYFLFFLALLIIQHLMTNYFQIFTAPKGHIRNIQRCSIRHSNSYIGNFK